MARRILKARRLNRWLRGRATLAGLLRLSAHDREELAWQAHRLVARESFAEAERLYELLALLWPESADARLGLGVCAQLSGRLADAERAYDLVLEGEPGNVYALTNRAEVRLLNRQREAARADLERASAAITGQADGSDLQERIERLRELVGSLA